MALTIEKYSSVNKRKWDAFLAGSKNGTFLFYRDYMEYHSDRFVDHSLMFYDNGALFAILPANIVSGKLVSHAGLTYGGIIVDHTMRVSRSLEVFCALGKYLRTQNIGEFVYKSIPHIYHKRPAEEDLYALFIKGFTLAKREPSAAIDIQNYGLPGKKSNGCKRALAAGMLCREVKSSDNLMGIVNATLQAKYKVSAVHTVNEIDLLRSRFPQNIVFIETCVGTQIVGGAILYVSDRVVHAQYLTSTLQGKQHRCMDFTVGWIIDRYRATHKWFDFGISTEQGGRYLNASLMSQKEEFGAFAIVYDTYSINTSALNVGDNDNISLP